MEQEGSAYGTGRHPHCKGGLSLWHKRAVHMAQEDIPIVKEGCPYGTKGSAYGTGLSPWHRKAVSIAQEGCPYGTRGQCIWHRKTSPLQRRAIPKAKEGCAYGTKGQYIRHRTVAMEQKSSLHGTRRHPQGKGGLSPWHRKAVSMAQEGIPMAQ
jgi:hypothetical protein